MQAAKESPLAPLVAAIEQRQGEERRKEAVNSCVASLPRHIESRLAKLEREGAVRFDGCSDRDALRDKVARKIRRILTEDIERNSSVTEAQAKQLIADLVDEHYEEFCE